MLFFVFLIIIEVFSVIVLREYIQIRSKTLFSATIIIHVIFSLWLWILLYALATYRGFFDNPDHVRMIMSLSGTIFMVVFPRIVLILFHYTGKLIRIRKGGYIKGLTVTGLVIASIIFAVITLSTLYGRFNFNTQKVTVGIKELNPDLDGLKIAQISDLHLASYYSHRKALSKAVSIINSLRPDLILNTGDFVSFGWREFDSADTILARQKSRCGNYAILGNHDFGTYQPYFTEADRDNNVLIIMNKIKSSGYTVLFDTNTVVKIGNARLGLIGVNTRGRYPHVIHDDLKKAMSGLDSVDLKILLSHDPNQWEEDVAGKTDIGLTLAGHSHGMQMGIYTRWFRWSPAIFIYPHWGGLYAQGDQYQYVNVGLGVLAIPFRICMPPEITLITLKRE
jgi:predicted MPP superfamily phosphohydrolase